jgi:hypothetical protein
MRFVALVVAALLLCLAVPVGAAVPSAPPVCSFTENVTGGVVPFTVQFTDTSTGSPSEWAWNYRMCEGECAGWLFNESSATPTLTITEPGTYGIVMSCRNDCGWGDGMIKAGYITALPRAAGDLNGNGRLDFADVVAFFGAVGTMPYAADLDLNGNGRMDFADVVALFARV